MFKKFDDISKHYYRDDEDAFKVLGVRQDTLERLFPNIVSGQIYVELSLHQAQNLYLLKTYCDHWLDVFSHSPVPNVTKLLYLPVPELGKSILQAMEEDIGWYERFSFNKHMYRVYRQIVDQQTDNGDLND